MPATPLPRLSGAVTEIARNPDDPLVQEWQRLVDARLIGNIPEINEAHRANIARTEALMGIRRGGIW